MRRTPPHFFENIRATAQQRWDQLEADPELAGPWWQLFRQVRSPLHTVSELLQNADDAGANRAEALVDDGIFFFRHNGRDFDESDFASLCRFAWSNKRRLLTIGFRGIGFRSVFALGPAVDVLTPTIACRFHERRFTEPIWLPNEEGTPDTELRVRLANAQVEKAIRDSIGLWQQAPIPLLFFRSLRTLTLNGTELSAREIGPGPIERSTWFSVPGAGDRVLAIRSREEPFPPECQEEIKSERASADLDLPPCDVLLLLGLDVANRVYVVLPTDLVLPLPISCQAPFVQDPARKGIKDPAVSPTNRWLLCRLGTLLGESMLSWLTSPGLPLAERAKAYGLLPPPTAESGDALTAIVANQVVDAFRIAVEDQPCVLTADGHTVLPDHAWSLPERILRAWDAPTAASIFMPERPHVVSPAVEERFLSSMVSWRWITLLEPFAVFARLCDARNPPPRPATIEKLIELWRFLAENASEAWRWSRFWRDAALVPVHGQPMLAPAARVLPYRTRPTRCGLEDWEFLIRRFLVLDPDWAQFTKSLVRSAEEDEQASTAKKHLLDEHARAEVLEALGRTGMQDQFDFDSIVAEASREILGRVPPDIEDGIRILRIAARLNVGLASRLRGDLRYLCADGGWRSIDDQLLIEDSRVAVLDEVLPAEQRVHLISDRYQPHDFSGADWRRWCTDPDRGGLQSFPLPSQTKTALWTRTALNALCTTRGGTTPPLVRQTQHFRVEDWDWNKDLVAYWRDRASRIDGAWADVALGVIRSWSKTWTARVSASVAQVARTYAYRLEAGLLRAAWVEHLRGARCLPDHRGQLRIPAELYRRTVDTVTLLEIEPFVREDLDQPQFHECLDLLGVRSQPGSADALIERLRALADSARPPLGPLRELYQAIDRVFLRLPDDGQARVRDAFAENAVVYTTDGWRSARSVFRENPAGIPGVAVVHDVVADLGLWDRLGTKREPHMDDALAWLSHLPADHPLPASEARSVRAVLARYPDDAWRRVERWINCDGQIITTADASWVALDRMHVEGLFTSIKRSTADLTMLDPQAAARLRSYSTTPALEEHLQCQVLEARGREVRSVERHNSLLAALGSVIQRLHFADDLAAEAKAMDRHTAAQLARTVWREVTHLRIQPALDGRPAGAPVDATVVWDNKDLLVAGTIEATFDDVVDELARHFVMPAARSLIRTCVGRDTNWIEAYAAAHFVLDDAQLDSAGGEIDHQPQLSTDPPRGLVFDATVNGPASGLTAPSGSPGAMGLPVDSGRDSPLAQLPEASRRVPTPSPTERLSAYLAERGFVAHGDGQAFQHPDGRQVRRGTRSFPWELVSGERSRGIWIASSPLDDANGVELPAEVWELGQKDDALLLEPRGEGFKEYAFSELRTERYALFAATYRLRAK